MLELEETAAEREDKVVQQEAGRDELQHVLLAKASHIDDRIDPITGAVEIEVTARAALERIIPSASNQRIDPSTRVYEISFRSPNRIVVAISANPIRHEFTAPFFGCSRPESKPLGFFDRLSTLLTPSI
jgi:hypothetical protein